MDYVLTGYLLASGYGVANLRLKKCRGVLSKYDIMFPPFFLGTLNIELDKVFNTPNWKNIIHVPSYELDEADNSAGLYRPDGTKHRECWELIPVSKINGQEKRGYIYRTTCNAHGSTRAELITEHLDKMSPGTKFELLLSDNHGDPKK